MTRAELDNFRELIELRCALLLELRKIAETQAELASTGDMNDLLRLLAAKQRKLNDLQSLERALDPFRRQDPRERPWVNAEERERYAKLIAASEQLLGELLEGERESEAALASRRDDLGEELARRQSAHRAHEAYQTNVRRSGSAIDQSIQG